MAELEKKSGTLKPEEVPTPRCGYGVDPSTITKGTLTGNSRVGNKARGM